MEPIVAERHEKLKNEMFGKLKDLGNNILGRFGFSLDTASWLFDFAWLAYYDPPDHARTPSSFGIMRIPHNFVVRR